MQKQRLISYAIPTLLVGLSIAFCQPCSAANKKTNKTSSVSTPTQIPAPEASSANPVVQSAAKTGVVTCLKRIDQVTGFLVRGAQGGVFLFPVPNDINRRLYTTSLEVAAGDTLAYASASFSPVGAEDCSGVYEAITYWPLNCKETAAKGFSQLKPAGVVKSRVQVLEGGSAMRVFLMPADKGCIAIKKEVMY